MPQPRPGIRELCEGARGLALRVLALAGGDAPAEAVAGDLGVSEADVVALRRDAALTLALAGPAAPEAADAEGVVEAIAPALAAWAAPQGGGRVRVLSLDLETTGKPKPGEALPVQVAWVSIEAGGSAGDLPEMRAASRLLRPGGPRAPGKICAESQRVHGITDEAVAGAPFLEQVARGLAAALDGADWVCGYNAAGFDLPVLASAADVCARDASGPDAREALGLLRDAARRALSRCLDPSAMLRAAEPRRLGDVLARAGVDLGDRAHEARADCLGALIALWREIPRWPSASEAALASGEGSSHVDNKRQFEVVGDEALAILRAGGDPPASSVVLRFGKHAGRDLLDLARGEPGYLDWVLGAQFEPSVGAAIRRARLEAAQARLRGDRQPSPGADVDAGPLDRGSGDAELERASNLGPADYFGIDHGGAT